MYNGDVLYKFYTSSGKYSSAVYYHYLYSTSGKSYKLLSGISSVFYLYHRSDLYHRFAYNFHWARYHLR
jgi:hypothetical protein